MAVAAAARVVVVPSLAGSEWPTAQVASTGSLRLLPMPGRKPVEPRGTVAIGRIAKLAVGQGHGFIRLNNGREIFFHRADVQEGISFNELSVGDHVTFEVLEDAVSGARAIRVDRRRGR